jgi:hypothetical protein
MMTFAKQNRRIVLVLAVVGCMLLAGCSGWGTDGPTDDEEMEDDESDDLEEADDEADEEGDEADDEDGVDEEEADDDAPEEDGAPDEDDEVDAPEEDDTDEADAPEEDDEVDEETPEEDAPEEDETDEEEADEDAPAEDEQYASPDAIEIEGVTHMESGTDHDEITVTNTHDELALPISGWEIELDGQDERIAIADDTIIEPGESHTIALGDGEKMLNEDGGVIDLYDAEGNHVGSWDHIGSPSAPPEDSESDETGFVQFTIEDAETGDGIEDAEVAVGSGDEQLTGATDGAGVTTVQDIPYGEHELTVTHEEYAEHTDSITVDEEETEVTIELEPEGENAAQTLTAAVVAGV